MKFSMLPNYCKLLLEVNIKDCATGNVFEKKFQAFVHLNLHLVSHPSFVCVFIDESAK